MKLKHSRVRNARTIKKRWQIVLIGFCCCAMFGGAVNPRIGGVWAQELPGEQSQDTLICEKEEHTHTDACYTLTCTNTDPAHVHDAGCYTLICGKEEHTHTDACCETVTAISADSSEPEPTPSPEPTDTFAPLAEAPQATPEPSGEEPEATTTPPETTAAEGNTISKFTMAEPITLEVTRGTSVEDVCAALPQTLPAVDEDGNAIEVPVTWKADSDAMSEIFGEDAYTNSSRYGYGPWSFTASADSQYIYIGEKITAQVSVPGCCEIESFCGQSRDGLLMKFQIGIGGSVNLDAITFTGAMMADGGYKNVPIAFSGSYDNSKAGTYRYEIQVTGDYTGATNAWAEIVVEDYR